MPEVTSLQPLQKSWASWFLSILWLSGFGMFIWTGHIHWVTLSLSSFCGWFFIAGTNCKRPTQFCWGMSIGILCSLVIEGSYYGVPQFSQIPIYAMATLTGALYGLYRSSFN